MGIDESNKPKITIIFRETSLTVYVEATVPVQLTLTPEELSVLPDGSAYRALEDQAMEMVRRIAVARAAYQSGAKS
jgi:hypothetical protein